MAEHRTWILEIWLWSRILRRGYVVPPFCWLAALLLLLLLLLLLPLLRILLLLLCVVLECSSRTDTRSTYNTLLHTLFIKTTVPREVNAASLDLKSSHIR